MKGNLLSCWVGVICLVVADLSQNVLAAPPPINGAIYFAGSYAVNGPLTNATAITNFSNVSITAQGGVYTNPPFGTPVSYRPFTFNPPAALVAPLWSFTNGGVIYSFDATSMTVVTQSSTFLAIQGTGIAHITGYADTPGTWTFGAPPPPNSFSSSAAPNVTNVPAFQTLWRTSGRITFNWNTLVGQAYQVQYKSNLTSAVWTNLGSAITATGSTAIASDVLASTNSSRFYRIVLLP
jgi:hypothetical protein